MFPIRFADRLLLLQVEANDGLVRLLDRLLLLDALEVLLLVLRDLLCVDINAVSVLSCVSLGGRGRVWASQSAEIAAMASPRTHLCWKRRRCDAPHESKATGRGRRAFEVLRELLRPLIQRIIISEVLVHRVSRVVQLRFEFLAVGLGFGGFRLQGFLFTSPSF